MTLAIISHLTLIKKNSFNMPWSRLQGVEYTHTRTPSFRSRSKTTAKTSRRDAAANLGWVECILAPSFMTPSPHGTVTNRRLPPITCPKRLVPVDGIFCDILHKIHLAIIQTPCEITSRVGVCSLALSRLFYKCIRKSIKCPEWLCFSDRTTTPHTQTKDVVSNELRKLGME